MAAGFQSLLQAFFVDRLVRERRASPNTVAAYRDSFRLLLRFVHDQVGKEPSNVALTDLDAPLVGRFLEHLEVERGNSARTRNVRLAAIHSFSFRVTEDMSGASARDGSGGARRCGATPCRSFVAGTANSAGPRPRSSPAPGAAG